MRYRITHSTFYAYDRPVMLDPHVLRLQPRSDVTQRLRMFSLEVNPKPSQIVENVDLDGNSVLHLWFPSQKATDKLDIHAVSEVETFRTNPFDFLLERWAVQLPIDYPSSLFRQLQPYLVNPHQFPFSTDPIAHELSQEMRIATGGNTVSFLTELNQRIYDRCKYGLRETGAALPPSVTWNQQHGSCRDFAVLFMEVCRAAGLAARFVSGYQEGDPDLEEFHPHAWAEVYLPGAGWRGFDPTNAVAVADRHIALVASPFFHHTSPVSGALKAGTRANSEMQFRLKVEVLD